MTSYCIRKKRNSIQALVAGILLITCAGCQTCSLSKEDFEKQQRGQMVDRTTGENVAVVGTLSYYGFAIGEMLATVFGK